MASKSVMYFLLSSCRTRTAAKHLNHSVFSPFSNICQTLPGPARATSFQSQCHHHSSSARSPVSAGCSRAPSVWYQSNLRPQNVLSDVRQLAFPHQQIKALTCFCISNDNKRFYSSAVPRTSIFSSMQMTKTCAESKAFSDITLYDPLLEGTSMWPFQRRWRTSRPDPHNSSSRKESPTDEGSAGTDNRPSKEDKMMAESEKSALKSETPANSEKLTLYQRFKKTYKEHGKVLVVVHLVTSAVWFGSFYAVARCGVDIVPYLESWGLSEKVIAPFRSGGLGDYALAYLMYKLASPARYTVTIGGTNLAIRYLRREGKMQPVPKEDTLRSLYKEGKEDFKKRSSIRFRRINRHLRRRHKTMHKAPPHHKDKA